MLLPVTFVRVLSHSQGGNTAGEGIVMKESPALNFFAVSTLIAWLLGSGEYTAHKCCLQVPTLPLEGSVNVMSLEGWLSHIPHQLKQANAKSG